MIALGLSAWWPTPSNATTWFTETERSHAASYHAPLHKAAVFQLAAQVLGIAAVWVLATDLSDLKTVWITLLVALVWWAPPTLVEVWNGRCHEPAFGHPRSAPSQLIWGATASLALHLIVFAALASVVILAPDSAAVPMGIGVFLAVAFPVAALLLGPALTNAIHRSREIEGGAAEDLARLGMQSGLPHVRFMELRNGALRGSNAFAAGVGRRATVSLSPDLVSGAGALRSHVVAHELAHLRRRHGGWTAAATGAGSAAVVAAAVPIAWLMADGGARVPMLILVAVVASAPVHLGLSWLSRAYERRADLDAAALVGTSPDLVRVFHLSDRALLEPSRIARLFAAHPSPAERLEIMRRSAPRGDRAEVR